MSETNDIRIRDNNYKMRYQQPEDLIQLRYFNFSSRKLLHFVLHNKISMRTDEQASERMYVMHHNFHNKHVLHPVVHLSIQ